MRYFPLALMFATLAPAASAQFGSITRIHPTLTRTKAELVDVDGDGVLDLVTLESLAPLPRFSLSWSKGGAPLPFGASQPIATLDGQLNPAGPDGRITDGGDLNGDGFVDLVVATTAGLVRIDGGPGVQFSAPVVIHPGDCNHAQLIDLDLDGDLDIARGGFQGSTSPNELFLLNDGLGGLTPQTLTGLCCNYGVPLFTDADLDGDLDFILVTGNDSSVRYFENLGGLTFADGVGVFGLDEGPFISLGDVDLDGDDDLLFTYYWSGSRGWYENVGGSFSVYHSVGLITAAVSAPRTADVDGDGDNDLVFIQDVFESEWYANDGNNQFSTPIPIDGPRLWSSVIDLIDIDGDDALDILIAAESPFGVYAFPNIMDLGDDVCTATVNSTGVPAGLRASGTRSVSANRFTLTLHDAPPGQLAAFLVGRTAQVSTLPGSAGTLCLGAPFGIFRGPGQIQPIDGGGTFRLAVDLTGVPGTGGLLSVQSGETWIFQSLFRDFTPLGSTNLSPAIEVTFVP